MSDYLYGNVMKQLGKREKILQLGCGVGSLGKLMLYSNYNYVRGVDVADRVIASAKASMPTRHKDKFIQGYFDDDHVYDVEYDAVICVEVFDYADCDIPILDCIKKGAKVLFTVPGHPNEAHPRWFKDEKEIKSRFRKSVSIKSITPLVFNDDYCKTYLVNCIKK